MSIYGLLLVCVGVVVATSFAVSVLAYAYDKHAKRCKHSHKFYDGDKHAIVCEDCGHVIVALTAKQAQDLTLEEFCI